MTSIDVATRRDQAMRVVRHHAAWSAAASLIPTPIAGFIGVSAVQIHMLARIAELYGVPESSHLGQAIAGTLISTILPYSADQVTRSLIGHAGRLGNVLIGASIPGYTGLSTYALGVVFVKDCESGGVLLSLDLKRLHAHYSTRAKTHDIAGTLAPVTE